MPSHLVCGRPGSGKTAFVMRWLVRELAESSRTIVTNLPIRMDKLHEYLCKKYPDRIIDLDQRIRKISTLAECSQFWRYRGRGADGRWVTLPPADEETGQTDMTAICPIPENPHDLPDDHTFSKEELDRTKVHRCLYAIDEAYNFFSNRFWQKIGLKLKWYISQHRKFGDEVIFLNQADNDLDKSFFPCVESFIYMRNTTFEKFLGVFKAPKGITWEQFPRKYEKGVPIQGTGRFQIDPLGISGTYNTDSGVGVPSGMGGDVQRKRVGVPIWIFFAIVGAFVFSARYWTSLIGGGVTFMLPKTPSISVTGASNAPTAYLAAALANRPGGTYTAPGDPLHASLPPAVRVTGLSRGHRLCTVWFSDGNVLTVPSAFVIEMDQSVTIGGGDKVASYWFGAPPSAPGAQTASFAPAVASTPTILSGASELTEEGPGWVLIHSRRALRRDWQFENRGRVDSGVLKVSAPGGE